MVKVEMVNYEKVMGMKEKMMIKKNGKTIMVVGMEKMKKKVVEGDWEEVERKDGMIKSRRCNKVWWDGKLKYYLLDEMNEEWGKKWLRKLVNEKYGEKDVVEEKEEVD